MSSLKESIRRHEGWRDKAYQDSEGIWTVGYGRNLQELEIDKQLGETWLEDDLKTARLAAERIPEYSLLTDERKDVLVEMVYNMGPSRVAGFRMMLAAIRDGDWEEAAIQMLDSKWARQVGVRARRLAKQMESSEYWTRG
jgi:lysozyme